MTLHQIHQWCVRRWKVTYTDMKLLKHLIVSFVFHAVIMAIMGFQPNESGQWTLQNKPHDSEWPYKASWPGLISLHGQNDQRTQHLPPSNPPPYHGVWLPICMRAVGGEHHGWWGSGGAWSSWREHQHQVSVQLLSHSEKEAAGRDRCSHLTGSDGASGGGWQAGLVAISACAAKALQVEVLQSQHHINYIRLHLLWTTTSLYYHLSFAC